MKYYVKDMIMAVVDYDRCRHLILVVCMLWEFMIHHCTDSLLNNVSIMWHVYFLVL